MWSLLLSDWGSIALQVVSSRIGMGNIQSLLLRRLVRGVESKELANTVASHGAGFSRINEGTCAKLPLMSSYRELPSSDSRRSSDEFESSTGRQRLESCLEQGSGHCLIVPTLHF